MDSTEQHPGLHPVGSAIFQSSIFQSLQKRRLILCLLLVLITLALYNPVTRAPFLNFDDVVYVTDNPQVHAGLTWNTVVWAFHTSEAANWHPVTWLSHALDCQIFGLNPVGPHIINVLLHAVNVVLLFLILESATGLAWRSLAVAALFALHPMNVESVAWIAERKDTLAALFDKPFAIDSTLQIINVPNIEITLGGGANTLDALGITHHTLTDEATMPFIVDSSIKQAFSTQAPVAIILSPLLTGGNPAARAKLKS